jgi:hypothetical protein
MALPCTPANITARNIAQSCENAWPTNNDDCNKFVKAALGGFLGAGYFDGMNADAIVAKMKTASEGWKMTTVIADAIDGAKAGNVVIAGMTAAELSDTNGHLAVVVGCDGAVSGTVPVPQGYAGSLTARARLDGGRLSGTFLPESVQDGKINYFIKPAAA